MLYVSQEAKSFAKSLGEDMVDMEVSIFFNEINSKFYNNDPYFTEYMDYFLEIIDRNGECFIEYTKLVDFGITKSTRSDNVQTRLSGLNLKEDKDYIIKNEPSNGVFGGHNKLVYYLTPDSFKRCVVKAWIRDKDDSWNYPDYFSLFESIYRLYGYYRNLYNEKIISDLKNKIDKKDAAINKLKDIMVQMIIDI